MANPVVFIVSNEAWGNMHYSKHHYAIALSKHTDVYFIDPPAKWNPSNLLGGNYNKKEVKENLSVINYIKRLPATLKKSNEKSLVKKIEEISKGRPAIFWQFDPFRFSSLELPSSFYRIYHVVDQYSHIKENIANASKADLIISVSKDFNGIYEKTKAKKINIPHGINANPALVKETEKERIINKYGEHLLWCGTFSPRVDYSLLEKVAKTFSDRKLLVLAKTPTKMPFEMKREINLLKSCSNVKILPPQIPINFQAFIAASEACLITYRTDKSTIGTTHSSLKFNQYLAHGKPIISTYLSEYSPYCNELVLMTQSHEDYLNQLKKVLDDNWHPDPKRSKEYIASHQYDKLLAKIMEELPKKFRVTFAQES